MDNANAVAFFMTALGFFVFGVMAKGYWDARKGK